MDSHAAPDILNWTEVWGARDPRHQLQVLHLLQPLPDDPRLVDGRKVLLKPHRRRPHSPDRRQEFVPEQLEVVPGVELRWKTMQGAAALTIHPTPHMDGHSAAPLPSGHVVGVVSRPIFSVTQRHICVKHIPSSNRIKNKFLTARCIPHINANIRVMLTYLLAPYKT